MFLYVAVFAFIDIFCCIFVMQRSINLGLDLRKTFKSSLHLSALYRN